MYELQFSKRSKNHARYFGPGPQNILAFYYNGRSRLRWLASMRSSRDRICADFGKPVVLGEWGDNWVWCASNITGQRLNADIYAFFLAKFIQATYGPVREAFGRI